MKCIVHREGRRWVLDANTIPDAVERADFAERWSGGAVQLSVADDVTMVEDAAPSLGPAFDLPAVSPCMLVTTSGTCRHELRDRVLVVSAWSIHAGQALRVDVVDRVPLELAVAAVEAAVARWEAAKADKLEHVETYKSGKRAGQPRFTARQDKRERAEIRARHRRNQARELARSEAVEMLSNTLYTVASEQLDVADERALAPVAVQLGLVSRLVAAVERAPWDESQVAVVAARRLRESVQHRLTLAESVRDYGFAVGERANRRRNQFSREDGPVNPVTITGIVVYVPYGREDIEHARTYVCAAGREWQSAVEYLEKLA